ncbi:MAG: PEP-CTERM sorting domain-containing protein [Phycisphaerae bacterium]|nr:PEP-CTERM sorting domain-containing protein [Phycisphaerae bacterium]
MKVGVIFVLLSCSCAFAGLVNGNAETGNTDGWQIVSEIIHSVQSQKQSAGTVTPAEGNYFFSFCKAPASYGMMSQTGLIGSGVSSLTLSGLFQGEYSDYGVATLSIFNQAGTKLASATRYNMTSDFFQWVPFQVTADLPQSSYSWEVTLEGFLDYGSMVNVFYDDITLVPEPATLCLLAFGALALRRKSHR